MANTKEPRDVATTRGYRTKALDVDAAAFYEELGGTLKMARKMAGLSQEKAASAIGVSFQQIQKYERGHNRIAVNKLITLANLYGVSVQLLLRLDERARYVASRDLDDLFYEMTEVFLALPSEGAKQAAILHCAYLSLLFRSMEAGERA